MFDMFDVNAIRDEFPALSGKVYGKPIVYFDNAATSQRPRCVLEAADRFSVVSNANIHRAVHRMADDATQAYEAAREAVRAFIGADSAEEIIFTSGATAAMNLAAFSFCERFVSEGDVIVVSAVEHHSDIVPWQLAALREAAHARSIPVLVDGAQGIVHEKTDVKKLGCDFYAFSGHKIFAATGTGILYGRRELLEEMPPYMGGGEMVGHVTFDKTTYAPLPLKFEAGTPNFIGQATFTQALGFAGKLFADDAVEYTDGLTAYMYDRLACYPGLKLFGECRTGRIPLFSFNIGGVHHEDLALVLDKMGIAVRSGQLCAEPLMDRFGVTGMVRASLLPYNTKEEIDYFMESLDRAVGMLK